MSVFVFIKVIREQHVSKLESSLSKNLFWNISENIHDAQSINTNSNELGILATFKMSMLLTSLNVK